MGTRLTKESYRLLDGQDDALDNDIMPSQSPRGGDGADVESLKAARPRREVDTPSEVEMQSYNYPDHYIGLRHGNQVFITRTAAPKRFKLISPGLCGVTGTISFQSAIDPNKFLRHGDFLLYEDPFSDVDLYKKDASFFLHKDKWFPGHDAFESVNYPGRYIRHQCYRLKLHPYQSVALFKMDASFRAVVPTCYKFEPQNYPSHSWGLKGDAAYIKQRANDKFVIIRPGLAGHANSVSFRSSTNSTKYLRHASYVMWLHSYDPSNSALYKNDATFTVRSNKWFDGFDVYESVNYPSHFIRHKDGRLMISSYDGTQLYKKDGSFKTTYMPS